MMEMSMLDWLRSGGSNSSSPIIEAAPEPAPAKKPEWDDVSQWADAPRDEWVDYPLLELLPEDRQRYWQQRRVTRYSDGEFTTTRYHNTSTSVIEAEVFAQTMGRLAAALSKLERKL